jgi:hypothetical protein
MDFESLNPKLLLGAGGIGVVVFKCWDQIKIFLGWVMSIFIVSIDIQDDRDAQRALSLYIMDKCRPFSLNERSYKMVDTYVKKTYSKQSVLYRQMTGPTIFFQGWRFFWISESSNYHTSFRCIRGLFNSDRFMIDVVDYYNETRSIQAKDRFYIKNIVGKSKNLKLMVGNSKTSGDGNSQAAAPSFRTDEDDFFKFNIPVKWKRNELGPFKVSNKNYIPCSKEIVEIQKTCIEWKNSERWHRDRGVPWKLGWLFIGEPGTGKTSLVKTLGEELDFPIRSFDLASLTNEELLEEWGEMTRETPCIALLEDIDTVFDGRKNISGKEDGLTFDCLLNCLDGVRNSEGLITVITSNVRDSIDPAICAIKTDKTNIVSSRPGRVDKEVTFTKPDREHMQEFCKRVLPEHPLYWDSIIEEGLKYADTSCQFQSRCTNLARSLNNESEHTSKLQEIQNN